MNIEKECKFMCNPVKQRMFSRVKHQRFVGTYGAFPIEGKELIKHFFRCSYLDAWEYFDFDKGFQIMRSAIQQKLYEHGLVDHDYFIDRKVRDVIAEEYCNSQHIDYPRILKDVENRWQWCQRAYTQYDQFRILQELYDKIDPNIKYSLQEKIQLFDACIHAEHVSGTLLSDYAIYIGNVRNSVDREIVGEFSDEECFGLTLHHIIDRTIPDIGTYIF